MQNIFPSYDRQYNFISGSPLRECVVNIICRYNPIPIQFRNEVSVEYAPHLCMQDCPVPHAPLLKTYSVASYEIWRIPCAILIIAVLIPIIFHRESRRSPPEFPGLRGAVCWMMFSTKRPSSALKDRPRELITPVVTVDWNPNGLPILMTNCPIFNAFECPKTP